MRVQKRSATFDKFTEVMQKLGPPVEPSMKSNQVRASVLTTKAENELFDNCTVEAVFLSCARPLTLLPNLRVFPRLL